MEIAATGTPAAAARTGSGKSALGADFDTFLRMLTVQMQNQDPLNPVNSTDFAVQLATFSQVEQQVRTNELLGTLGSRVAVMGLSQLAGWVGLEARVSAPAGFTGAPVELAYAARPGADGAELLVTDSRGQVVQRRAVDVAGSGLTWTGEGLPPGSYGFRLVSYSRGVELGTDGVEHYSAIREARNAEDGVALVLASGAQVAASAVSAVRRPEP